MQAITVYTVVMVSVYGICYCKPSSSPVRNNFSWLASSQRMRKPSALLVQEIKRRLMNTATRQNIQERRQKRTVPLLSPSKKIYILGDDDKPLIMVKNYNNKLIVKVDEKTMNTNLRNDERDVPIVWQRGDKSRFAQTKKQQKSGLVIKTSTQGVPSLSKKKNFATSQQVRTRSAADSPLLPSFLWSVPKEVGKTSAGGGGGGGQAIKFVDDDGTFGLDISSSKVTKKEPKHSFVEKDGGVFSHHVDGHSEEGGQSNEAQIPTKFLYLFDKGEMKNKKGQNKQVTTITINLNTQHDEIQGAKLNLRMFNHTKLKAFYLINPGKSFKRHHLRSSLYNVQQSLTTKWLTIDFTNQLLKLIKKHGKRMLLRIQTTSTDAETSTKQRKESYVKLAIKPPKARSKRHKKIDCGVEIYYLNLGILGLQSIQPDNTLAIPYCAGICNGENIYGSSKCCVPSKWGKREPHAVRSTGGEIIRDIWIEKNVLECECR